MPRILEEFYKNLSSKEINWVIFGFIAVYLFLINIAYRVFPEGLRGDALLVLSVFMAGAFWYWTSESPKKGERLKQNALILLGSLLIGSVVLWVVGSILLGGIE